MSLEKIPQKRPTSTTGKVLYSGAAIFILLVLVVLLLLPWGTRQAGPAARKAMCKNNLAQISLALSNYHDVHGRFPPAYTVDEDGNRLHSWRTLILPYMDTGELFDQIDFSKPWNDPANLEVFEQMSPFAYSCPMHVGESNQTTYLALVSNNTVLRPQQSLSLDDLHDGGKETIVLIEVPADQAVPWMEPSDASPAVLLNIDAKSNLSHADGFHAVFADGERRFIKVDTPVNDRRAWLPTHLNEKTSNRADK